MSVSTVQQLVLQRASDACGGLEALSRALKVPLADLNRWIDGKELAPTATFNRAVDLIRVRIESGTSMVLREGTHTWSLHVGITGR